VKAVCFSLLSDNAPLTPRGKTQVVQMDMTTMMHCMEQFWAAKMSQGG